MPAPIYDYAINAGPYAYIRAYMNGLPIFRRPPTDGEAPTTTMTANPVLVRGVNRITYEILMGRDTARGFMLVQRQSDPKNPIVRWDWPPPDGRLLDVFPMTHTEVFEVSDIDHEQPWVDSERVPEWGAEVPEDLKLAVQSVHHAVATNDVGALVSHTSLKQEHLSRVFPDDPDFSSKGQLARFGRMLPGMQAEPFRHEELVYERHLDGRVAYVTCVDGRKAIRASRPNYEGWFETDLWLTKKQGVWRVFR